MMQRFMAAALLTFAYQTLSVAAHTAFGTLEDVIQAARKNVEPAYIEDMQAAFYANKLAPYAASKDLTSLRAKLVLLLTQRSYVSLAQITGQRTAILYFYDPPRAAKAKELLVKEKNHVLLLKKTSHHNYDLQQDTCGGCCCVAFAKEAKLKLQDPVDAAQAAALAAGLNDAAWNPAWLWGGDPWGPSWDLANNALISYFYEATEIANNQIRKALVGITDPDEQGHIAYRVAEWVALNYYFAKAIDMFDIAYNIIATALPVDAKNPFINRAIWWRFRDGGFTHLGQASKVYVDPWLKIYDGLF